MRAARDARGGEGGGAPWARDDDDPSHPLSSGRVMHGHRTTGAREGRELPVLQGNEGGYGAQSTPLPVYHGRGAPWAMHYEQGQERTVPADDAVPSQQHNRTYSDDPQGSTNLAAATPHPPSAHGTSEWRRPETMAPNWVRGGGADLIVPSPSQGRKVNFMVTEPALYDVGAPPSSVSEAPRSAGVRVRMRQDSGQAQHEVWDQQQQQHGNGDVAVAASESEGGHRFSQPLVGGEMKSAEGQWQDDYQLDPSREQKRCEQHAPDVSPRSAAQSQGSATGRIQAPAPSYDAVNATQRETQGGGGAAVGRNSGSLRDHARTDGGHGMHTAATPTGGAGGWGTGEDQGGRSKVGSGARGTAKGTPKSKKTPKAPTGTQERPPWVSVAEGARGQAAERVNKIKEWDDERRSRLSYGGADASMVKAMDSMQARKQAIADLDAESDQGDFGGGIEGFGHRVRPGENFDERPVGALAAAKAHKTPSPRDKPVAKKNAPPQEFAPSPRPDPPQDLKPKPAATSAGSIATKVHTRPPNAGGRPHDEEAVARYLYHAEQGDVDAAYNLGVCYEEGRGVEKDAEAAFGWYAEAAAGGDADALFSLGVCYKDGFGTKMDGARARRCWKLAAERGNADAAFILGYKRGSANVGAERDDAWGQGEGLESRSDHEAGTRGVVSGKQEGNDSGGDIEGVVEERNEEEAAEEEALDRYLNRVGQAPELDLPAVFADSYQIPSHPQPVQEKLTPGGRVSQDPTPSQASPHHPMLPQSAPEYPPFPTRAASPEVAPLSAKHHTVSQHQPPNPMKALLTPQTPPVKVMDSGLPKMLARGVGVVSRIGDGEAEVQRASLGGLDQSLSSNSVFVASASQLTTDEFGTLVAQVAVPSSLWELGTHELEASLKAESTMLRQSIAAQRMQQDAPGIQEQQPAVRDEGQGRGWNSRVPVSVLEEKDEEREERQALRCGGGGDDDDEDEEQEVCDEGEGKLADEEEGGDQQEASIVIESQPPRKISGLGEIMDLQQTVKMLREQAADAEERLKGEYASGNTCSRERWLGSEGGDMGGDDVDLTAGGLDEEDDDDVCMSDGSVQEQAEDDYSDRQVDDEADSQVDADQGIEEGHVDDGVVEKGRGEFEDREELQKEERDNFDQDDEDLAREVQRVIAGGRGEAGGDKTKKRGSNRRMMPLPSPIRVTETPQPPTPKEGGGATALLDDDKPATDKGNEGAEASRLSHDSRRIQPSSSPDSGDGGSGGRKGRLGLLFDSLEKSQVLQLPETPTIGGGLGGVAGSCGSHAARLCWEVVSKYLKNALAHPTSEKYLRIPQTNATYISKVACCGSGVTSILASAGWQDEKGVAWTLPPHFDHKVVSTVYEQVLAEITRLSEERDKGKEEHQGLGMEERARGVLDLRKSLQKLGAAERALEKAYCERALEGVYADSVAKQPQATTEVFTAGKSSGDAAASSLSSDAAASSLSSKADSGGTAPAPMSAHRNFAVTEGQGLQKLLGALTPERVVPVRRRAAALGPRTSLSIQLGLSQGFSASSPMRVSSQHQSLNTPSAYAMASPLSAGRLNNQHGGYHTGPLSAYAKASPSKYARRWGLGVEEEEDHCLMGTLQASPGLPRPPGGGGILLTPVRGGGSGLVGTPSPGMLRGGGGGLLGMPSPGIMRGGGAGGVRRGLVLGTQVEQSTEKEEESFVQGGDISGGGSGAGGSTVGSRGVSKEVSPIQAGDDYLADGTSEEEAKKQWEMVGHFTPPPSPPHSQGPMDATNRSQMQMEGTFRGDATSLSLLFDPNVGAWYDPKTDKYYARE